MNWETEEEKYCLSLYSLQMNSAYGLISTKPICSLPNIVGSAYLPYHPGCIYAALPVVSDRLVIFSHNDKHY